MTAEVVALPVVGDRRLQIMYAEHLQVVYGLPAEAAETVGQRVIDRTLKLGSMLDVAANPDAVFYVTSEWCAMEAELWFSQRRARG